MTHSFPLVLIAALLTAALPVQAVELRQIVSREHPAIQGTGQGLAVGRDGNVYVSGVDSQGGYVLRISRDGLQKFGSTTTYAITGVAGRATAFLPPRTLTSPSRSVSTTRMVLPRGKVGGFTGNDQVGWDGPGTLEVGSSGDFFALDQHVGRIVQINPTGDIVRSYPLPVIRN